MPNLEQRTLTSEQRAKILEFFAAEPNGGYKRACAAAGIITSKTEAKALILADDVIADAIDRAQRLDEPALWAALSEIVHDPENASRLRAIQFAFGVRHGISLKEQVEHSGRLAVDSPDVAAAIDKFTALAAAAVGAASRSREDAAARELNAGGEGGAGVRVGPLAGSPDAASAGG